MKLQDIFSAVALFAMLSANVLYSSLVKRSVKIAWLLLMMFSGNYAHVPSKSLKIGRQYNEKVINLARIQYIKLFRNLRKYIQEKNERGVLITSKKIRETAQALNEYKEMSGIRKIWVAEFLQTCNTRGEFRTLVQDLKAKDQERFFTYFRMDSKRFDQLLSKVEPFLRRKKTPYRDDVISPAERLALTIRYLAHGDSQRMLGISYRIGRSTVCKIIRSTCQVLC